MNISVYELTIPQFMLSLKALSQIMQKAEKHAEAKKIKPEVVLGSRLAMDMFPFYRQVQIATDNAKGCASRLTGVAAPVFEDGEQNFAQLQERVQKTIQFLEGIKPESFQGFESRKAEFPWLPGKYLEGKDYLVQHAIPNYYFHVAAAYAILRTHGVELGKGDFLGNQNWKS